MVLGGVVGSLSAFDVVSDLFDGFENGGGGFLVETHVFDQKFEF